MSKSKSQQIAEKTIFAAFTILKDAGGEMRGKDVVDKIRERVTSPLVRESFRVQTDIL